MRVFVTGATGFLGGHVVGELLQRGHQPVCLLRHPLRGRQWGGGAPTGAGRGVEWVRGALAQPATFRRQLASCEAVIHLACCSPAETEALWSACLEGGPQRFLYVSALGAGPASPDPRLRAKAQTEAILSQPAPIGCRVVRPSLIFGPGDRFVTALEYWVRRLPWLPAPAGRPLRAQPIFVEDLAVSLCNLAEQDLRGFRVIEAGGPDVLTFSDMLELVGAAMGRPVRTTLVPSPVGEAFYAAASRLGIGPLHPWVWPLLGAGSTCPVQPFMQEASLRRLLPFGPAIRRYVESL